MKIENRPGHDPVTDLYTADAYMRWALLAAEEVVGKQGGDKLAYITEDCPMCAGKLADEPICWLWTGSLKEAAHWQTGKEFEVVQVACRAMGDPACVWEIGKTPKE